MLSNSLPILKSRFRLVTFDVTNTLLNFRSKIGEEYSNAAKLFGVECNPQQLTTSFKAQWKVMTKKYPNYGKSAGLTSCKWWENMINLSFSNANCHLSNNQLKDLSNHLYALYSTDACWKVVPGAVEILQLLQKYNVTIGVISNFDERLEPILEAVELRTYFRFVLASYVINHEKPDRKIFDIALSKAELNGLTQSEAIHIGDNYELDYLAAKNAGWNAILYTKNPKDHLCSSDETVSNFYDISKIILEQI